MPSYARGHSVKARSRTVLFPTTAEARFCLISRLQLSPQPELSPTFLSLQNSTFRVADLNGELAGFDFDHLLNDPLAWSPVVGNTLVYNGAPQRSGVWVTRLP